ncbi:MAG: energy-coupled thiamine transporter ThiT [Erysipelotrichaceae bacterium]
MNKTTRVLVYVAAYVGLATVLNYLNTVLPILQMPNGGSLELMVIPIFVASYHLGWKMGMAVGVLSWLVGTMFGMSNYMVSPLQVFFDYIAPVMAIGLASLLPSFHFGERKISNVYIGIFIGMLLKYASQVISGAYFWPGDGAAGSLPAWIFSLSYNFGYNALTLGFAIVLTPILIKALRTMKPKEFVGIKD